VSLPFSYLLADFFLIGSSSPRSEVSGAPPFFPFFLPSLFIFYILFRGVWFFFRHPLQAVHRGYFPFPPPADCQPGSPLQIFFFFGPGVAPHSSFFSFLFPKAPPHKIAPPFFLQSLMDASVKSPLSPLWHITFLELSISLYIFPSSTFLFFFRIFDLTFVNFSLFFHPFFIPRVAPRLRRRFITEGPSPFCFFSGYPLSFFHLLAAAPEFSSTREDAYWSRVFLPSPFQSPLE